MNNQTRSEQSSKLELIINSLDSVCSRLATYTANLDRSSDKLLGCVPEASNPTADAPCRQGLIGQLEDVVGRTLLNVNNMEYAVMRIVDSGTI